MDCPVCGMNCDGNCYIPDQEEPKNSNSALSDGLNALAEDWERQLKVLKSSIDDAGKGKDFGAGLMWQYHHQKLSMCLSQLKTVIGI